MTDGEDERVGGPGSFTVDEIIEGKHEDLFTELYSEKVYEEHGIGNDVNERIEFK